MRRNLADALRDLSRRGRIHNEADLREKLTRQISNKINTTSGQIYPFGESVTKESILKNLAPHFADESPNPYFRGQKDAEAIFELPIECRGMVFSPERYPSFLEQSLYCKGVLSKLWQSNNRGDFDQIPLLLALRRRKNLDLVCPPYEAGLKDAATSSGYLHERFDSLRDKITYTLAYVKQFFPDFSSLLLGFLRDKKKKEYFNENLDRDSFDGGIREWMK